MRFVYYGCDTMEQALSWLNAWEEEHTGYTIIQFQIIRPFSDRGGLFWKVIIMVGEK